MSEDLKKFKEALNNDSLRKKFSNVKNLNEVFKIAKENGYRLNEKAIKNDTELSEDLMNAVAGGIDTEIIKKAKTTVTGNNCRVYHGGNM